MKYLKFMPGNDIKSASRNKRELACAHEYGYQCYCYCENRSDVKIDESKDGFSLIVPKIKRPEITMPKIKRLMIIFKNVFVYMAGVKKAKADVISCHNIFGLSVAYFAHFFVPKSKKPKFIYDSHEFELNKRKRNAVTTFFIKTLEGFLIKKCAFTIMINESIADSVAKIHKYDYKRIIIRSTPDFWNIDEEVSRKMHDEYCDKLKVPRDSFIVLYHGMLVRYRGIEELLKAMSINNNFYSVMVGDLPSAIFNKKYFSLVKEYGVEDRILQYPLQPQEELWKYVSAADCGVVMNNTDNPNYIYALPNKFFENIQSMTPIICTNSLEMSRIINEYDIGILSPSGDGEKLAENIERMRTDKELYAKFKKNLVRAKSELCWENEKKKFFEAYDKYL